MTKATGESVDLLFFPNNGHFIFWAAVEFYIHNSEGLLVKVSDQAWESVIRDPPLVWIVTSQYEEQMREKDRQVQEKMLQKREWFLRPHGSWSCRKNIAAIMHSRLKLARGSFHIAYIHVH